MPTPLIEACIGVRLLLEYHPYRFPAAMLMITLIIGVIMFLAVWGPRDD